MAREMKDSGIEWLGSFPLEWEWVPLWSLIKCRISGSWGDDPKNDNNDRACMRIADFDYDNLSFKKDLVPTMRNYSIEEIENKALSYGDMLIEKSGGGEKTPVGRAVVYRGKGNELFANFMDCIRFNAKIDVEFAKYIFASLYSRRYTNLYFNQTTGLQNFNTSRFIRETFLPLPCLIEQAHIASYLDSKCAEIDKAIETTKASIEEYKKLRQAIITESVTKGLDPTVEMKDSGCEELGKIPKTYEILSLSKKVSLYGRIGFRGYTTSDLVEEGEGAITLSPGNILDNGKLVFDHCSYLSWYKYDESPEIKVKNGDILLVKTGSSYGKSGIVEELPLETTVNPQLIVIKDFNCINKWLFYFMQTAYFKSCCESIVGGGTIPTMSQQKIAKIKIAVPSRMEQMQITKYLDTKCFEIDSLIKSKEKLIEELTAYRKSLIYEYVTGKKEVPIESA